ncbi:MAG: inositol monophosphatase family protein [Pseudomonadales bacterium]
MLDYSEAVPVSPDELDRLLAFALTVAEEAGRATLPYFRSDLAIDDKRTAGRFDPVTEADREAERVIRTAVSEAYPEHGVFGEEFGYQAGNGLTWVVDPIDGTRAFMTGMLHWGVLLALFDGQRPVLGVLHQPFTGESFYGDNHVARYRRGELEQVLRCRPCASLNQAVLATTSPKLFSGVGEREAFERLEAEVKLSRYGGDCYIYAMLAMGLVDVATDAGLHAYDIQALMPIIRGAGGVVSTLDGGDSSMGGLVVAAGSPGLHSLALARMMGE